MRVLLFLVFGWFASMGEAQVCGDCTQDGFVTAVDAMCVAQIAILVTSPTPLQFTLSDVNSDGLVNVLDALLIAQFAAGLPVTLACVSQPPSCSNVGFVGTPSPLGGWIWIHFDTADVDSPTINVSFDISTDSGLTWSGASPAPVSPAPYDVNPALAVPPGLGQTFIWDSTADLPGFVLGTARFRVSVTDGFTTTDCWFDMLVANGCYCIIQAPVLTLEMGQFPVDFDIQGCSPWNATFQYSTNGGITFTFATPAAGSPLGNPAVGLASPGSYSFLWDSAADIPFGPLWVRFRINGAGLCFSEFQVQN